MIQGRGRKVNTDGSHSGLFGFSGQKISALIFLLKNVWFFYKKGLRFPRNFAILIKLIRAKADEACGLVAQLDRVFDYESKGRGFESRGARH